MLIGFLWDYFTFGMGCNEQKNVLHNLQNYVKYYIIFASEIVVQIFWVRKSICTNMDNLIYNYERVDIMKKVLLGPSGGTAASMGAFMQYWVQKTNYSGETMLVPEMWRTMAGLTSRQVIPATKSFVEGWDMIGGSPIIPSCKNTNVFKIEQEGGETIDKSGTVYEFCKDYDGIVAVGGGGTTRQCTALKEAHDINSIIALATMDNDIYCFDDMLGFRTAVYNSAASINACSNDAQTMQRPTMVFAMGYDCGRLSVSSVKYARKHFGTKIDLLHIPETNVAIEDVAAKIRKSYNGGDFNIVIGEGVCKSLGTDDGTHKKFSTDEYAKKLMELTGIEFKVLMPDYMQRSGVPVYEDRILAHRFAQMANHLVDDGRWNYVIGSVDGFVIAKPFEEIIEILDEQNSSSPWYATHRMSLDDVEDILIK